MSAASGAMGGIGSVMSAYGSEQAGSAQYKSLLRAAQIQKQNAALAIEQGDYDALRNTMSSDVKIGAESASYGASGVRQDSGSALDVLQMSARNAMLDTMNILHGAEIKSIAYKNQASFDEVGANSALEAGQINAVSAMFGGAGRAAAGNINANAGAGSNGNNPNYTGADDFGEIPNVG